MMVGRVLGERYRLLDRVGAGGMAVVWRARDQVLERDVAVKVLAPSLAADPALLGRIRAEAQAAGRLRHPHVVGVHDFGEDPVPYVVMELVPGRSLASQVANGPLPWQTAVVVCAQVASALAAAHEAGVVHRDVTPGNVMLTSTGVKLVDFGISATVGEADAGPEGHVLGTPAYLAPERVRGGPARAATDVYALGLLLYKALTGRLPWQTSTTTQMVKAHVYIDPAPLPDIEGLPAEVADLCQRCLAKAPDDRPTSATAAAVLAEAGGVPATQVELPAPGPAFGRAVAGTMAVSWQSGETAVSPRRSRLALAGLASTAGLLLASGLLGGSLTATPPASASFVASGFAPREVSCQVRYEVSHETKGRFAAGVTVTNTGVTAVDTWRLEFAFPADQRLVGGWTPGWQQTGDTMSMSGSKLPAGGSLKTGFDGTYRAGNPLPVRFRLNAVECVPELVVAPPVTNAEEKPAGESGHGKRDKDEEDDDDGHRGKG